MDFNEKIEKYAKLIMEVGINLEEGQLLVLRAPIEARELVHACVSKAYEMGASDIEVIWSDDFLTKTRYENVSIDNLRDIRPWFIDKYDDLQKRGAAFLSIVGSDPELLKRIDPDKVKAAIIARSTALKNYQDSLMSNENSWCVVAAATEDWASKVFPHLTKDKAVEELWDNIFYACRINEDDPVEQWTAHIETLQKKSKLLNEMKLTELYYSSSNGTKLRVKLPKGHVWTAAGERNVKGRDFVANIPTEEVFTLPHREHVNGIVYNTKPLNYAGNIIDFFFLEFKDGRVVDYNASLGKDTLEHLLESDTGAMRLGEVALVPYDSPISNTDIMFLNTLFDENASCHLALGKAYPTSLKGGDDMDEEELLEHGVNDSLIHEDFMIGSKDMDIVGTREDGSTVQIFKNGNWAI